MQAHGDLGDFWCWPLVLGPSIMGNQPVFSVMLVLERQQFAFMDKAEPPGMWLEEPVWRTGVSVFWMLTEQAGHGTQGPTGQLTRIQRTTAGQWRSPSPLLARWGHYLDPSIAAGAHGTWKPEREGSNLVALGTSLMVLMAQNASLHSVICRMVVLQKSFCKQRM